MDTRFLESFLVVADCGSIAEAARRLNLTPAAVAQRLKAVEQEIGQPLVSRNGRTVRPTASGLAILQKTRELVRDTQDLKALAANNLPAGELRLGATATALTGLLPGVVANLAERYPQIEFNVRPGSSMELYSLVLSGEIDASIIIRPQFAIPKSAGWMTLLEEPLVLIAPLGMTIEDPNTTIGREPFIRYDRNQWGGQIVDRYLRQNQLVVHERLEMDALDAIAALVDRGLGVAVVPEWSPPWPADLSLQRIALPAALEKRRIGILWGHSSPRTAAVHAFVNACEETFPESLLRAKKALNDPEITR